MAAMRKLVAILLLSLISLQTSWAAAAGYCQHEQGVSATHFGHHEHKHESPKAAQSGISFADADCSLCQAGFLTALTIQFGGALAVLAFIEPADAIDLRLAAPPLDLPERPNWA
ncbi:MAG: hypothetical protein EBV64_13965 [Oxalobacteraceae bacterium]|jgi:hypothetical protein|nr:hypothetical protein [Oxalobacteraceae bacterium]